MKYFRERQISLKTFHSDRYVNSSFYHLFSLSRILQSFEAHVRVTNIRSGEVYMVRERVEKNRVTLKMNRYTEEKLHLCIYSRSSGFGHTVYGK